MYIFEKCNHLYFHCYWFFRLDGVPFVHVLRLVILDVVVLAVAILVFIVCYKVFNPSRDTLSPEDLPVQSISHRKRSSRLHNFLLFVGKFIDVLFLAACGIIVPSVASAVYFLSFLYIATWWSFYRGLGQKFAIFRICVLVWSGLHLAFLHLYQMQLFQEDWLPSRTSFWARYQISHLKMAYFKVKCRHFKSNWLC